MNQENEYKARRKETERQEGIYEGYKRQKRKTKCRRKKKRCQVACTANESAQAPQTPTNQNHPPPCREIKI